MTWLLSQISLPFFPVIYSNKVPLMCTQEVNVKSCATIERLSKILRHSYLDFGVVDSEAACVPDVSRCEGPTWALLLFNAAKRSWFDLETNQAIFFVILFEQYIRCPNWWKISKCLFRQKPSSNSNLLIDVPAIEIPRRSTIHARNSRQWKLRLPERSDTAANFLRGFGCRGGNFFLLILIIVEFLVALFLHFHRLLDRFGGGRLRLQRERQSMFIGSVRWFVSNESQLTGADDFLPTFTRPREDNSPPSRPEFDLAGAGVTGAAGSSS